jgi:hypothetical protein
MTSRAEKIISTHFEDCTHCENGNRTRYGCCQFCDGFGRVEVGDELADSIEDLDQRT